MRKISICAVFAVALFTACSDKDSGGGSGVQKAVMNTVSITVSDSTWTYFSLQTGRQVGTSALADEQADAAWAEREDWDFALCSDMLKTNSGTSGSGQGGVQAVIRLNFNALEQAPASGYVVDADGVVVKR